MVSLDYDRVQLCQALGQRTDFFTKLNVFDIYKAEVPSEQWRTQEESAM